jgi:multidrug efflux system membrane fusion protein
MSGQIRVGAAWAGVAVLSLVLMGCTGKGEPGPGTGKGGGKGSKKGDAIVPVMIAPVSHKTVPVEIQVIGNVEAYATIGVKAQVGGELTRIDFQEGDFVKKGNPLFSIDRRPFDAAVSQVQANLARDTAQLRQAEANLSRDIAQEKYARAQAARYQSLFQQGIISREHTEQFVTDADAKAEAVSADRAAIESAKAAMAANAAMMDTAKIQLGYTTIRSPIDGRTGNLTVKAGSIVKPNDIDLVTINQLEPIYVTFAVPEARLPDVKRYMAKGRLKVMVAPEKEGGAFETGYLSFVDNAVDMTTGTIKLKGTFTNTDHKLWPGQFVRVVLRLADRPDALVVPTQALQTGQDGQFVFVVKQDMTVESRPVTVGARVDQDVVIESGLSEGERVITEGQLRLAPGSRVRLGGGGGGPGGGKKRGG